MDDFQRLTVKLKTCFRKLLAWQSLVLYIKQDDLELFHWWILTNPYLLPKLKYIVSTNTQKHMALKWMNYNQTNSQPRKNLLSSKSSSSSSRLHRSSLLACGYNIEKKQQQRSYIYHPPGLWLDVTAFGLSDWCVRSSSQHTFFLNYTTCIAKITTKQVALVYHHHRPTKPTSNHFNLTNRHNIHLRESVVWCLFVLTRVKHPTTITTTTTTNPATYSSAPLLSYAVVFIYTQYICLHKW